MSLDGQLHEFDVLFLLRSMIERRQSTRLLLADDQQDGEIVAGEGLILSARIGEISGLDALFELLTWKDGSFHVAQGGDQEPRNIGLTWNDVLREAFRRARSSMAPPEEQLSDWVSLEPLPEGDPAELIVDDKPIEVEKTESNASAEETPIETGTSASSKADIDEVPIPEHHEPSREGHESNDEDEAPSDQVAAAASVPIEPDPAETDTSTPEPEPEQVIVVSSADEELTTDTARFAIDASKNAESHLLELLPRLEIEAVRLSNAGPSEGTHVALRSMARLVRFVKSNPTLPEEVRGIDQPIDDLLERFGLDPEQPPSGEALISAYHGSELDPDSRRRTLLAAARASLEITALHFRNLTSTFDSADEKLRFREAYQTVLADLEHRLHEAPL